MNIYQMITDRIVKALENGCVPWKKPFTTGYPRNLISKKPYRGINTLLLQAAPYSSPWWLTFNQAKQLGGQVKKGEHGYPVVFWKLLDKKEEEAEEKTIARGVPFLRYYTAFNVCQCEGLDEKIPAEEAKNNNPIGECAKIVEATGAVITDGNEASYSPSIDEISMPLFKNFVSSEKYYSTIFHELTHWTGHKSRLARDEVVQTAHFGSADYSKEELVAEMGAAFLSGMTGIAEETVEASASYISSWLKKLKDNPKWVVMAGAQAQKAADYIMSFKAEEVSHESEIPSCV